MEKENGAPDISAVSARHNDVGHLAAIICVTIQDIAVPAGTPTARERAYLAKGLFASLRAARPLDSLP